jgi:hypothetical protein
LSNGSLCYLENGKFHHSGNNKLLKKLVIRSFYNGFLEDTDGSLLISTNADGIVRIGKDGKITWLKPVTDIPSLSIAPGMWKDESNQVRFCTRSGVINLSKNPGLVEIPIEIQNDEVRYSKNLRNGGILIGTGRNVLLCRPPSLEARIIGEKEGYSDILITCIEETREGDLWISSMNGLHLFRKGKLQKEAHQVFFEGKAISDFHFDRQGNLWITTLNEGVFLVYDLESRWFDNKAGLPEVTVTSLLYHKKNLFWGNDRGEIGIIRNNKNSILTNPLQAMPYGRGRIREFGINPANPEEIWAAGENGVLLFQNQELKGILPAPAKSLTFLPDMLYLGTSRSCVRIQTDSARIYSTVFLEKRRSDFSGSRIPSDVVEQVRKTQEFLIPDVRVYKVASDASGTIWMATQSGLISMQYGAVSYLKESVPELGLPFQNLCLLEDGRIALGSNGRGVLLLDQDLKINWIGEKEGLSSSYIRNLKAGRNNQVWVCTAHGINRIYTVADQKKIRVENWTSSNSILIEDDIFDLAANGDSLWLASGKNIQCIPSIRLLKKKQAKIPLIESVEWNGKKVQMENGRIWLNGPGILQILFRNPDFRNYRSQRFQYRLLPDSSWTDFDGGSIKENFREAGMWKLEFRLIENQNSGTIQVAEIQIGSFLDQLGKESGLSSFAFLLYLIPSLLLLFAVYLGYFHNKAPSASQFPNQFKQNLEEFHQMLLRSSLISGKSLTEFNAFRETIRSQPEYISLTKEVEFVREFARILTGLCPEFSCQFSIHPEENLLYNIGVKNHPILSFLIENQIPMTLGLSILYIEISNHNQSLLLRIVTQHSEQFSDEPDTINSRIIQVNQDWAIRLILRMKQLFPWPILHRMLP